MSQDFQGRLDIGSPVAERYLAGNVLVCADNLGVLKALPDECIDLVYLDPPFKSDQNYAAIFGDKGRVDEQLRDVWRWTVESEMHYQGLPEGPLLNAINAIRLVSGETSKMAAYALFMGRRLVELWRVLKTTGSLYLHCDDTASHYLRVLLDAIFGEAYFRNVMIWRRAIAHNDANRYGRIADHILFYGKTNKMYWNARAASTPKSAGQLANAYATKDEKGPVRFSDLTGPGASDGESGKPWKGYDVASRGRHWAAPKTSSYAEYIEMNFIPGYRDIKGVHARLDALDEAGLIHHPEKGFWPGLKRYAAAEYGNRPQCLIWEPTGFTNYNKKAGEYIGYPTQKPLGLIEPMILASSPPGGLVLDPFCGCGTAVDAAAKLGRRYLGIDVSAIAVRVMEQRLKSRGGSATPMVYRMNWEDYEWDDFERRALMPESDAEDGTPGWAWAEDKVAGLINAVPNQKKIGDGGVDARYFTAADEVIPIQVKMHKGSIGRPDLDKLLGVQTSWNNRRMAAPMSLMITLYPSTEALRVYASQQGKVTLRGEEYPKMQVFSVQEMLTKQVRPKLPPVDPRYFVGNTQTRLAV